MRLDGTERIELFNGRFVDVEAGRHFPEGTRVVLRGERIEAVAGPSTDAPPAVARVDLGGRTAIPGLFNTHCHLDVNFPGIALGPREIRRVRELTPRQVERNLAECLAHGVTTIRDAWTEDLRANRSLSERIAKGTLPGPRILQSVVVAPEGNYMAPRRGLRARLRQRLVGLPFVPYEEEFSGVVSFPPDAPEKVIRDAVDRAVDERGADYVKLGDQRENRTNWRPDARTMEVPQLTILADHARKRGIGTVVHLSTVAAFRRAVQAGVSTVAHLPLDAQLTRGEVEAAVDAGLTVEPTVSLGYGFGFAAQGGLHSARPELARIRALRAATLDALLEEFWLPELAPLVRNSLERLDDERFKVMGIVDVAPVIRLYGPTLTTGRDNVQRLFCADVVLGCGNDAGVPPHTIAMVGHELRMFRFLINDEEGSGSFDAAAALRVATIDSARVLGRERDMGSITAGKLADLVLLDGDPLADADLIGGRVAACFKAGRLVVDHCGLEGRVAAA